MRILIISSGSSGCVNPFVKAQADSLEKKGINIQIWLIPYKGISGYLKSLKQLGRVIKYYKPNLIHAHYGLSGLLSNMQIKIPVITTYHGCDINVKQNRKYSYLSTLMSADNIFVHPDLAAKVYCHKKQNIIPVGINIDIFKPLDRNTSRKKAGFDETKKYILFSSKFDNPVKNYPLAKQAISLLNDTYQLVELKGYSPEQLNVLYNAADALLVTSHRESGPLVVKEAMAAGTPIVTVDVGDVKNVVGNTRGTYVCETNPAVLADRLLKAVEFRRKYVTINGRQRLIDLGLDDETIALKIIDIYNNIIN
jgi:teichuronic acid biosynthesis glycosyltransferase TuaC